MTADSPKRNSQAIANVGYALHMEVTGQCPDDSGGQNNGYALPVGSLDSFSQFGNSNDTEGYKSVFHYFFPFFLSGATFAAK
jgi:hypothetical protein